MTGYDGPEPEATVQAPSEEVVLARAAWSRLVEPGDEVAGAVVAALGPVDALAWLRDVAPRAEGGGTVGRDLALAPATVRRLNQTVRRWSPRLPALDPAREVDRIRGLGGTVLVPEGPGWPRRLGDLGPAGPACLWVLGASDLDVALARSVSIIGARACTHYGELVTAEIAAGLATRGWCVLSGGAYGIDAVAHRAALAAEGASVAVLAGGVERPYPAGNARIFAALTEQGGSLVSEVPPGSVPSRSRFLQRNRLIAAASGATVVVEAAWRSGALSTAGHAARLLRPVGAVPGPVTSAASAGCHRLIRDGAAVCVTDAEEVGELAGGLGSDLADARVTVAAAADDLPVEQRRTLDALPVRRGAAEESVARAAGLTVAEVRSALGLLELRGLVAQDRGGWRVVGPHRNGHISPKASPAGGGSPRSG